jgi:hypothetical protein
MLTHLLVYVISLYLVFQILTRSDDHEILSHLPGPLRPSNYLLDPQQPYHLPYHLPHLPSPLPSSSSSSRSDTTTTSTFRVFLGILVYPVYVLITLLATPLPLLLNGLSLLLLVLNAVLYPFTSTLRFLTRTILLGPLAMFVRVAEALYPVSTFVAGVVGVGCVMGAGAGYAGRAVVDLLLGGKKRSKRIKRSKSGRQSILADRSEKDVGEKKGRSTISPSTESSGQVPTIPAAVHSKLFSESRSRKVRTGTGESERDWRDGKAGKEGRDGEAMGVRRRTSHLGR